MCKGYLLHSLGRNAEAIESYGKATTLNLEDYLAWRNRAAKQILPVSPHTSPQDQLWEKLSRIAVMTIGGA